MSCKWGVSELLLAHCGRLGWSVSLRPLALLRIPIGGYGRGGSITPQTCVKQYRWGISNDVRDVVWGRRRCLATASNRKGGGGRQQQHWASKRPLMNDKIKFPEVRVANTPSKNGGTHSEVMKLPRAKQLAASLGKDLVLISTQQNPSVCRLMEYDKEAYCKKKEAQKNKMMSKSLPVKEVRIMAFIAENDLQRKLDNAIKCMIKGHTVIVKIMARIPHLRTNPSCVQNIHDETLRRLSSSGKFRLNATKSPNPSLRREIVCHLAKGIDSTKEHNSNTLM